MLTPIIVYLVIGAVVGGTMAEIMDDGDPTTTYMLAGCAGLLWPVTVGFWILMAFAFIGRHTVGKPLAAFYRRIRDTVST